MSTVLRACNGDSTESQYYNEHKNETNSYNCITLASRQINSCNFYINIVTCQFGHRQVFQMNNIHLEFNILHNRIYTNCVEMPNERKESRSEFLLRMTQMFPKVFRADRSVLYCLLCDCVVTGQKLFQVKQHIGSGKHKAAEKRKRECVQGMSQSMMATQQSTSGPSLSTFNMDLCRTFLESNIPLYKLKHPSMIQFLEKYTTRSVPDESTLRRNYVPCLYENMIEKLRLKAADKRIWISVDETTDIEQRMVASFVFGILDDDSEHGKSYLLNAMELSKVNANTIATFTTDSLSFLWPTGECFFR